MNLPSHLRLAGPFQSNAGFRQTLARARDQAANRFHRRVRPSHLLAGLLARPDARVTAVFEDLGIAMPALVSQIASEIGRSVPPHDDGPDLALHREPPIYLVVPTI